MSQLCHKGGNHVTKFEIFKKLMTILWRFKKIVKFWRNEIILHF